MYGFAAAKIKVVWTAAAQTLIATACAERVVDGFGCCASRIFGILKHFVLGVTTGSDFWWVNPEGCGQVNQLVLFLDKNFTN